MWRSPGQAPEKSSDDARRSTTRSLLIVVAPVSIVVVVRAAACLALATVPVPVALQAVMGGQGNAMLMAASSMMGEHGAANQPHT